MHRRAISARVVRVSRGNYFHLSQVILVAVVSVVSKVLGSYIILKFTLRMQLNNTNMINSTHLRLKYYSEMREKL